LLFFIYANRCIPLASLQTNIRENVRNNSKNVKVMFLNFKNVKSEKNVREN